MREIACCQFNKNAEAFWQKSHHLRIILNIVYVARQWELAKSYIQNNCWNVASTIFIRARLTTVKLKFRMTKSKMRCSRKLDFNPLGSQLLQNNLKLASTKGQSEDESTDSTLTIMMNHTYLNCFTFWK